jgi:DNA-directed RNA polymerase specialized sigma24 family protein
MEMKSGRPREMGIEQPSSGDGVYLEAFDQHRSLLFSIAYGMLGSVADAEGSWDDTVAICFADACRSGTAADGTNESRSQTDRGCLWIWEY